MKKTNLLASVLLCLMLAMSVFADGETGNGGRSCNPQNEQCSSVTSNPTSTVSVIVTVISQIAALVK